MARTVRSANLETRAARLRLPRERFHWAAVSEGLALGYRRAKAGHGSWTVRAFDRAAGKYVTDRIGRADDYEDADGRELLTYFQAQDRARSLAAAARSAGEAPAGPCTVQTCAQDYLEWFRVHRKSYAGTKTAIDAHILPRLGKRPIAELTTRELAKWHEQLAASPARVRGKRDATAPRHRIQDLSDPAIARRRRATANRVLSVLRAILNHAWRDGRAASDAAWRRVKPFHNASEPLVRWLEPDEARRLVNACAADLRSLVRAGLLTGCRYGELVALRVGDYRPPFSAEDAGAVYVRESKSGRPRSVPLSREGTAFFDELTAGRAAGETLLLRAGFPWGKNHQVRELSDACERAKIVPAVSFHVLRHTYGSWLAQRGVPLQVIAAALGHSDTRITHKHYGHLAPSYIAQVIRDNLPQIAAPASKVKPLRARPAAAGATREV